MKDTITANSEFYAAFIKYFEGYKHQEIAKLLNMPVKTVKSRIREAQSLLRTDFNAYREKYKNAG